MRRAITWGLVAWFILLYTWSLYELTADAQTRPTLQVSGVPPRISGPVDWTITASGLDTTVTYTLSVDLPDGLALDVGCAIRTRTYVAVGAATYSAPPSGETLRLQPCATGEHTVLVTLEADGQETVRSQTTVTVDQVADAASMADGLLRRPSVAEIIGARRYDDLVLVVYYIDYTDVAMLPEAPDAWWVDGQAGSRSVASAVAPPYVRGGWGHGILALTSDESVTQVVLTGMPGRYAAPLGVTAPVTAGGDLGSDLILALRSLQAMAEWEGQELVAGQSLAADGVAYAQAAIPDLRERAPGIYSTRILDIPAAPATPTMRDDQGILPVEALTGMTSAAAQTLHLPEMTFRILFVAVLAVVAAGAAIKAGGSGMLALPAIALVLLGGTIIGFVPLPLTLGIALLSAFVVGYALWGKRA